MEDHSLVFGVRTKWKYCLLKAKKSLEQTLELVDRSLLDFTRTVSRLGNVLHSSRMKITEVFGDKLSSYRVRNEFLHMCAERVHCVR